jgi:hypothetical protein
VNEKTRLRDQIDSPKSMEKTRFGDQIDTPKSMKKKLNLGSFHLKIFKPELHVLS